MNKANTIYIQRKKSMRRIESTLVERLPLKLCYKNDKEMIFKNDDFLITCRNRFVSVLVYGSISSEDICTIREVVS